MTLATQKGSLHNIRSGQSFVFQVEVEGCLVG